MPQLIRAEKLVLINKNAKCRGCDNETEECTDVISDEPLVFPAYKNLSAFDQQCYNASTIQKTVFSQSGQLTRDPRTASRTPTYWKLPRNLDKAGRFDVNDIYATYVEIDGERRDTTNATALFNATFGYADVFDVPDILKLADIGMKEEAKKLFDLTLRLYPPPSMKGPLGNMPAIQHIVALCTSARLPRRAAELFNQHVEASLSEKFPAELPVKQIIALHYAGLVKEAATLFLRSARHIDLNVDHAIELQAAGLHVETLLDLY